MKVTAAQIIVTESKSENLVKLLEYIKKAKNSDVICFPELSLQDDSDNVLPIKRDLNKISIAAKKYSINVIFGSYIKHEGKIKNRIFVINKNGDIIHRYNKKHPYISEIEQISAGRNNKIFNLDNIPCAVINCWDYAFPEYGRELARKGAKIIFCPAYLLSHPQTSKVLEKIPQVRAFDYMAYFVMVDAITTETFKRSKICHPLKVLAEIKNKEGIITTKIDLSEINKLRDHFKNFSNKKTN